MSARRDIAKLLAATAGGIAAGQLARLPELLAQSQGVTISEYYRLPASAIVFKDGDRAVAIDDRGRIIARSTDHAEVIQSTIDALTNGGIVFIKSGKYYLNDTIIVNREYISLVGEGIYSTWLNPNFENKYMFEFTSKWIGGFISDILFNATIKSGVGCLKFDDQIAYVEIRHCFLRSQDGVTAIETTSGVGSFEVHLSANSINGSVNFRSISELFLVGNKFSNGTVLLSYCGQPTIVANGFESVTLKTGYSPHVRVINNWWSQHANKYALYLGGYDGTYDIIEGNDFRVDTDITDEGHCIRINAYYQNHENVIIKNNMFVGGKSTSRAIEFAEIGGAQVLNCLVDNNDFTAWNGVKLYGVNFTRHVIRQNLGLITENRGIATITTGSTSVTVSHGLVSTPSKINVTPLGDPSSRWWVANVTDTSFDIVLASAPTTDVTFYWEAEV